MNTHFYIIFFLIIVLFISCDRNSPDVVTLNIYPDSIVSDVSGNPVGINFNFLMDGGRFPHPKRSVAEAIKDMGMKYLRYPGGEKSDLYLFSVPPYNKPEVSLARTAGLGDYPGMMTKDGKFTYDPLDFDAFMQICESADAEPVLVVAADCYLVPRKKGERVTSRAELIKHAAEWVRYANITKKYGVKYWMIGNESWNQNNENSNVDIYAQDVIDFSKAMKAVDPSILIISNGDSDEFFKTVITKAGNHIDHLCVSNYGVFFFDKGYQSYSDSVKCLIWPAQTALNAMNRYATKEQMQRLKLIVAEYGTIDWKGLWGGSNDMGHAIVNFDMTGQLLMEPQIEYSCFWNTRWIDNESKPLTDHDAIDKDGNLNPTGHSLKIWGNFLGKQMVKTAAPDSIVLYSSVDKGKGTLFAYIINKKGGEANIKLDIKDYTLQPPVQSWEYYGKTPEDLYPVWEKKVIADNKNISLKGYSITVLEYKLEH